MYILVYVYINVYTYICTVISTGALSFWLGLTVYISQKPVVMFALHALPGYTRNQKGNWKTRITINFSYNYSRTPRIGAPPSKHNAPR